MNQEEINAVNAAMGFGSGRAWWGHWEMTAPISVEKMFETAIVLCKAEGAMPGHLASLECRLPEIRRLSLKHVMGRTKHGIQFSHTCRCSKIEV